MRKLTQEEFIQRSTNVHSNKYDYSKVNYINNYTKINIICHEHGIFYQAPNDHLRGKGCAKCFNESKKLTQKEFIDRSNKIHNNKYDYSKVNYVNGRSKVTIICPEHGEFKQSPNSHLNNHGCVKCYNKKQQLTLGEFIDRSNKIHSDKFDYSKVNYIDTGTKVIIICKKHGEFKQKPGDHLMGQGCKKCKIESQKLTLEEFIQRSTNVHGNKYDYSKVNYVNNKTKVVITCPEHGEFKQVANYHLSGNGCPICNYSHGEREIYKLFNINNINFIPHHSFEDCRGEYLPLIFDFYIPSKNTLIEFDGIQHFEYIPNMQKNIDRFNKAQSYDQIKNDYALKKNITLIRIRYDESVEEKLKPLLLT